jgi:hypothetical protein
MTNEELPQDMQRATAEADRVAQEHAERIEREHEEQMQRPDLNRNTDSEQSETSTKSSKEDTSK